MKGAVGEGRGVCAFLGGGGVAEWGGAKGGCHWPAPPAQKGQMGKILGVDFGDRRTGLAVSDETGLIAFPRETLECPLLLQAAAAVARVARNLGVERIVVGYPLRLDGSPGPRAERTEEFIGELERRVEVPVVRWDERLSTCEVERVLIEAGTSRAKRKTVVDKLAAQVILQAYLDAQGPLAGVPGPLDEEAEDGEDGQ